MNRTYHAVLIGDHLEWTGRAPDVTEPTEVKVTVPDAADLLSREERRRQAANALAELSRRGGIDYEAWLASRTVLTSPSCDFSNLTPAERLELAERLRSSVDPAEVDWSLTPARLELEQRLAEHDRELEVGESWESIPRRDPL